MHNAEIFGEKKNSRKKCESVQCIGDNANPPHDEDCLNLNIYLPKNFQSSEKYPVLLNIHGGAFVKVSVTPAHDVLNSL